MTNGLSCNMLKSVFLYLQNLTILQERCSDPALSVRKQAMQSLTDLLDNFPQNKLIQKYVICNFTSLPVHVAARQCRARHLIEGFRLDYFTAVNPPVFRHHCMHCLDVACCYRCCM